MSMHTSVDHGIGCERILVWQTAGRQGLSPTVVAVCFQGLASLVRRRFVPGS